MDSRTLEALKGSIEKWRKIVAGTGVDQGSDNCPLCKAFPDLRCVGCPVAAHTGNADCEETPFYDFHDAGDWSGELDGRVVPPEGAAGHAEAKAAAQAELDFLISLLPEGER